MSDPVAAEARRARSPRAFRLAARLARREVRRRPGRTLLVAVLVAGPVAGMVLSVTVVRTNQLTADEDWRINNGQADLVASETIDEGDLPAGSRTVDFIQVYSALRTTDGQRARADVTDLPLGDPLAAGMVVVDAGRPPQAEGEVLLSPDVADRLDAGVGDVVDLDRPVERTVTVVGIGVRANATAAELMVTGPGTFPRVDDESPQFTLIALPDDVEPAAATATIDRLVEGSGVSTSPAVARLTGVEVGERTDSGNGGVGWSVVGGAVALTVAGIVIASAFAAGARRQLTTLGQLSANGAAPAVLRRVLFLQGTWIGVVGAALGLGLGAAALAMFAPYRARVLGRDVGPYDLNPTDLVPVVALALVAATLASMVPASGASRLPTLAALAGRRPLGRVPRWLTLAGVAGLGTGVGLLGIAALGAEGGSGSGGAVWTLLGIVGAMAVLLGACAVAPGYVSVLEPVGQHLGGAWRLAARSLARQRTRTGAVVSAVCATGALSVAAATVVAGGFAADADDVPNVPVDQVRVRTQSFDDQTGRPTTVTPSAELVAAIEDALGDAETSMVTTVAPPAGSAFLVGFDGGLTSGSSAGGAAPVEVGLAPIDGAAIFNADAEAAYDLGPQVRRALDDGGAVLFDYLGHGVGEATTVVVATGPAALGSLAPDPGAADSGPPPLDVSSEITVTTFNAQEYLLGGLPALLVTPAVAARHDLQPEGAIAVLTQDEALDDDELARLQEVREYQNDAELDQLGPNGQLESAIPYTYIAYEEPSGGPPRLVLEAGLAAVALLFTLFVVGVSLALAAAETRDERDILTAVGAGPATLRRTSGRKAVVLTVLGLALAVPVGFAPVAVVISAAGDDFPLVAPWRIVAALLVGVPLVAGLLTTAASALALRARPVHLSTMASTDATARTGS